jgi:hypothetical protein
MAARSKSKMQLSDLVEQAGGRFEQMRDCYVEDGDAMCALAGAYAVATGTVPWDWDARMFLDDIRKEFLEATGMNIGLPLSPDGGNDVMSYVIEWNDEDELSWAEIAQKLREHGW